MLWPKALQHFSFKDTDASHNQFHLTELGPTIALHKQSLRSIELVSLFSRVKSCIDLMDYPQLESLTISAWDIDCSNEEAASKLLAPRLKSFIWSFSMLSQSTASVKDFNDGRADWLRCFIALAVERKSALRKVHLDFTPDWYPGDEEVNSGVLDYPWDRMVVIAREFGPHGVNVSWNTPPMTKEEMKSQIEEDRKRRREEEVMDME